MKAYKKESLAIEEKKKKDLPADWDPKYGQELLPKDAQKSEYLEEGEKGMFYLENLTKEENAHRENLIEQISATEAGVFPWLMPINKFYIVNSKFLFIF